MLCSIAQVLLENQLTTNRLTYENWLAVKLWNFPLQSCGMVSDCYCSSNKTQVICDISWFFSCRKLRTYSTTWFPQNLKLSTLVNGLWLLLLSYQVWVDLLPLIVAPFHDWVEEKSFTIIMNVDRDQKGDRKVLKKPYFKILYSQSIKHKKNPLWCPSAFVISLFTVSLNVKVLHWDLKGYI